MKSSLILAIALTLATATAQATTIEMKVFGMVCGFCAQGIEKSLRKHPATAEVTVSLEHQLVAITTRDGADIPDADLRKAIEEAGYDLKNVTRTQRSMTDIRSELARTK
jgi:periplasmic mercuric ion binding protein